MTFALPNSIARLFQLQVEVGEEAICRLRAARPLAPWLTLLLAAAAIAIIVSIYRRESLRVSRRLRLTLAGVRIAIIGLVLLMIAQVTLILERRGRPEIVMLLDDSQSMSTTDPSSQLAGTPAGSRFQQLQEFLTRDNSAVLNRLNKDYQLRVLTLSERFTEEDGAGSRVAARLNALRPEGKSSPLGSAVLAALADSTHARLTAAVLLTDGVSNDGPGLPEAAEVARQRGVPLFFVGFGSDRRAMQLRLSDVIADPVVFVNEPLTFRCRLASDGLKGERVRVELREKDKPEVVTQVEVDVSGEEQPQTIRLNHVPKQAGRFEYILQAHRQVGTPRVESNAIGRSVEVRREPIRVLLAQAYPSFEFRYLRNLLIREKTIALDTILQEADPELSRQDKSIRTTFPSGREELFSYDVIICGDVNPALLGTSTLQNLADYIRRPGGGGAIIFIAGPSSMPTAFHGTPLWQLFPFLVDKLAGAVRPESLPPFVVRPTPLGLASPAMQLADTETENEKLWSGLAPLDWLVRLPELKPGVRVLAEHSARTNGDGRALPVICFQYVGSGKVLFHATDETWRWRYRVGDEYFARYWLQTLRYLCRPHSPGEGPRLTADRREYRPEETVRLRVEFRDETSAPADDQGVVALVQRPDGQSQQAILTRRSLDRGLFEGEIVPPSPGNYRAWLSTPAVQPTVGPVAFTVMAPGDEMSNVQMDKLEMIRAAERTGGRFYAADTAQRLLDELPAGETATTESLPPWPLWNRWPVLATFVALLCVEWGLRRRHGMA